MQESLQLTFRHVQPSAAVRDRIQQEVEKLEHFYDQIINCRAVIEAPHSHHHKGNLYRLGLTLNVPNDSLVVSHEHHGRHEHEDLYVAVRDAFKALRRQLEDYVRRSRGEVKRHERAPMPAEPEAEAEPA